MDRTQALGAIAAAYPELTIDSVEASGGQNSHVLLVNGGSLVFRFPRYEHLLQPMRVEAAVLSALRGRLPLPVPEPLWVHLQAPVGEAFVGHRSLSGEPLWREVLHSPVGQTAVGRLAAQLGGFLQALHSVPYRDVVEARLPRQETWEDAADLYARLRAKVWPFMELAARARATAHFESYLGDPANFAFAPVLRHGDFGASNILFDPDAGRVTGIIDWTSAAAGDPAYDVAGLLACYGEKFVRACARSYPAIDDLWGRLRHYAGRFPLEEALFGVEHGDEEALRAGLKGFGASTNAP
jgi:aminoglycoside 2''-phosphotransferase